MLYPTTGIAQIQELVIIAQSVMLVALLWVYLDAIIRSIRMIDVGYASIMASGWLAIMLLLLGGRIIIQGRLVGLTMVINR